MSDAEHVIRERATKLHAWRKDGSKMRHLGLCGRRDKGGGLPPSLGPGGWDTIHPSFRCAACEWIARGDRLAKAAKAMASIDAVDDQGEAAHAAWQELRAALGVP